MLKEKIKNSERLWKAIEILVKAAENEDYDRRNEILNVVQHLTSIHSNCICDFKNYTE